MDGLLTIMTAIQTKTIDIEDNTQKWGTVMLSHFYSLFRSLPILFPLLALKCSSFHPLNSICCFSTLVAPRRSLLWSGGWGSLTLRVNKRTLSHPLKSPGLDSTGSLPLPYPQQAPSMQFAAPLLTSLKITADKCSPPPPLPASSCTCTPSHIYTAPRHCWHFTSSVSLSLET